MADLEIYIAGLNLSLNSSRNSLNVSVPLCHKEFLQPAEPLQAGLHLFDKLSLEFVLDQPPTHAEDHLVYSSESWELWRSITGEWVFTAPHEFPPYSIVVSADFTSGKVVGEFEALAGNPVYPIEMLEIRLFSVWLATFGDLILHASGVAVDGRGYCFNGESGAGKSTLAAALAVDPALNVLGEDQVILRLIDEQFWIFGTPWHADPKKCSPLGVPLERLYFLDRALSPGVSAMKPADGVARLLQTAFVPYYLPEFLPGILKRLSLLAQQVPFHSLSYQLGSDPGPLLK